MLYWALELFGVATATIGLPCLAIALLGDIYHGWTDGQQTLLFCALCVFPLLVYLLIKILLFQKTERSIKKNTSISGIDAELRVWEAWDGGKMDIFPIICQNCDNDHFYVVADDDECVMEVECVACGTKKKMLDSEEFWDECEFIETRVCPYCETGEKFNIRVGFLRRENGDLRKAIFGFRCTDCRGIYTSWWNFNYGPTADIEKNI